MLGGASEDHHGRSTKRVSGKNEYFSEIIKGLPTNASPVPAVDTERTSEEEMATIFKQSSGGDAAG